MTLQALLARVLERVSGPGGPRVMIGIAGSPGAGKSTLAGRLVAMLATTLPGAVAHVPMDGFHLADVELARLGLSQRKGAPETFDAAGYVALLRRLRQNADEVVYAPAFERTLEQPVAGSIPVARGVRVIITEGNYLLLDGAWSGVRPLLDEVWFVQLGEAVRLDRLIGRHVEFGRSPESALAWVEANDRLNAELVAGTRDRADLVLDPPALGWDG